MGVYPNCDPPDDWVRRINHVYPDAFGNFLGQGDTCLMFIPFVWNPVGTEVFEEGEAVHPSAIELFSACTACCTCADYAAMYEAIRRMMNLAKSGILGPLVSTKNSLLSVIQAFNIEVSRRKTVYFKVRAWAQFGFVIQVQVMIANSQGFSVPAPREIELHFTTDGDEEGVLMPGSAYWQYPGDVREEATIGGAWPDYSIWTTKSVPSPGWLQLTAAFSLLDTPLREPGKQLQIRGTFTAPVRDETITVTYRGFQNPSTGEETR